MKFLKHGTILCFLAFCGFSAAAQDENPSHTVVSGETAADLAKKYMGDASLAKVILQYNRIEESQFQPGKFLIIPLVDYKIFFRDYERALEQIDLAKEMQAERFAPDINRDLQTKIKQLEEYKNTSNFGHGIAYAKTVTAFAGKAALTAKENAVIDSVASVVMVQGTVEYQSEEGDPWLNLQQNTLITTGMTIRTSSDSYTALVFQDQSRIEVSPSSKFQIEKYKFNRRNKQTNARLFFFMGKMLGDITPRTASSKDTFEVRSAKTSLAIRGTTLMYIVKPELKISSLSVTKGRVTMLGDGPKPAFEALMEGGFEVLDKMKLKSAVDVPAGFGCVAKDGKLEPLTELVDAPRLLGRIGQGDDVIAQKLSLEWEAESDGLAAVDFVVATDEKFENIVHRSSAIQSPAQTDVLSAGTYYIKSSPVTLSGLVGKPALSKATLSPTFNFDFEGGGPAWLLDGKTHIVSPRTTFSPIPEESDNGISHFTVSMNDDPAVPVYSSVSVVDSSIQSLTFHAIGQDGEVHKSKRIAVRLDDTVPTTHAVLNRLSGSRGALTLTAMDINGIHEQSVRIDGKGEFQTYTEPIDVDLFTDHVVEYYATDRLSNKSEIKTLNIRGKAAIR